MLAFLQHDSLIMYGLVLGTLSAVPLFFFLYSRYVAAKPRLYAKVGTKWSELLRHHVHVLHEVYTPTWWCPFGWAQTIVRQLFRSCPSLPWEREIMRYSDGGQAALDWLHPSDEKLNEDVTTPIVVFLPGITGHTHSAAYLLHAAMDAHERGWRVVVTVARGLGGMELLTPKTFTAVQTDDISEVLELITARYPNAKKMGVGFSLGGMIMWNYLAKSGSKEAAKLDGAIMVSSPWNSMRSTEVLETWFNRLVFNGNIAQGLLRVVEPHRKFFEDKIDWDHLMCAKTIREFDTRLIAPMGGYRDYEDYYHQAALYYKVDKIPIPLLAVNAADDCFAPVDSIPYDDVCRSENVAVCLTQHGGHTAFMQGPNPNDPGIIEKIVIQVGEIILEQKQS